MRVLWIPAIAVVLLAPSARADAQLPLPKVPVQVTLDAEGYFQAKWPDCVSDHDLKRMADAGMDLESARLGEPIVLWHLDSDTKDVYLAGGDIDPRDYSDRGYTFPVMINGECVGMIRSFIVDIGTRSIFRQDTRYRPCWPTGAGSCDILRGYERTRGDSLTTVLVDASGLRMVLLVDRAGSAFVRDDDSAIVPADSALVVYKESLRPRILKREPAPRPDMTGIALTTDTVVVSKERSGKPPPPPPARIDEVFGVRAMEILSTATTGEVVMTDGRYFSDGERRFDRLIDAYYPVLREGPRLTRSDIDALRDLVLDVAHYENIKYACISEPDFAFILDAEPEDLTITFSTSCLYIGMRCGETSMGVGTVRPSSRDRFGDFVRSFWRDDTGLLLTIRGGMPPHARSWRRLWRLTVSLENLSDEPIRVPTSQLGGSGHTLLRTYHEDGMEIPSLCLVSEWFSGSWADHMVLQPGVVMNFTIDFLPPKEPGRYHYELEFYGARSEQWPDMWHGTIVSNRLPVLKD